MSAGGSPVASTSGRVMTDSGSDWSGSESDCSVVFPSTANTPLRRKINERLDRLENGRGPKRSRQTLVLRKHKLIHHHNSDTETEDEDHLHNHHHHDGRGERDEASDRTDPLGRGAGCSLLDGSPALAKLGWPAPLIPLSPDQSSPLPDPSDQAPPPSSPFRDHSPALPSPSPSPVPEHPVGRTGPSLFADALPSPFLATAPGSVPAEELVLEMQKEEKEMSLERDHEGEGVSEEDTEVVAEAATAVEAACEADEPVTDVSELAGVEDVHLAPAHDFDRSSQPSAIDSRPVTPTRPLSPAAPLAELLAWPPSPFLQSVSTLNQTGPSVEATRFTEEDFNITETVIAREGQAEMDVSEMELQEVESELEEDPVTLAELTFSEEPVFESDDEEHDYALVGSEADYGEEEMYELQEREDELEFDETTFREHHLLDGFVDTDEDDQVVDQAEFVLSGMENQNEAESQLEGMREEEAEVEDSVATEQLIYDVQAPDEVAVEADQPNTAVPAEAEVEAASIEDPPLSSSRAQQDRDDQLSSDPDHVDMVGQACGSIVAKEDEPATSPAAASPVRLAPTAALAASPARPTVPSAALLSASTSTPVSLVINSSILAATPEAAVAPASASSSTPSARSRQPAHAAPAAKRQLAAGGFRPTRPATKTGSLSRLSGLVAAPIKKAVEPAAVVATVAAAPAAKPVAATAAESKPAAARARIGGLSSSAGVVRSIKPTHSTGGGVVVVPSLWRVPLSKMGLPVRGLPTMVKRPVTGGSSDGEKHNTIATSRPGSGSSSASAGSSSGLAKPTTSVVKPRTITRPPTATSTTTAPGVKPPAAASASSRPTMAPSATVRRVLTGTSGARPGAAGLVRPPSSSAVRAPGSSIARAGPPSRLGNSALNGSTNSNTSASSGLARPRAALIPSRLAAPAPAPAPAPPPGPVAADAEQSAPMALQSLAPTPSPPTPTPTTATAPVQSLPLLPRPTALTNALPRTGNDNVLRSPRKAAPPKSHKTETENAAPVVVRQRISPPPSESAAGATHRLNISTGSTGQSRQQIFGPGPPSPTRVSAAAPTPTSNPATASEPESTEPSVLTAPAEEIAPEIGLEWFSSASAPVEPTLVPLPRPERVRKLKPAAVEDTPGERPSSTEPAPLSAPAPAPAPLPPPARVRAVRTHTVPTSPPPAEPLPMAADAQTPAPLPRLSRKAALLAAQAAAEAEAARRTPSPPPLAARPTLPITPAPFLTADQLLTLTQKHTRINKANFNKLDVETVVVDANRPPSPTSKIRKSLAPGAEVGAALTKASTKEGREERAAKRRGALRSSLDGSQLDGASIDDVPRAPAAAPVAHFRAPGDDEEFRSPARSALKVTGKGKKKSSIASGGERKREPKVLRWDKALVYEGPLPRQPDAGEMPIIRRVGLGEFGNWVAVGGVGARPVAVHVKRLVYRDDVQARAG